VTFYAMRGGGHSMPSRSHPIADTFFSRRFIGPVCRDVEAAKLVWDFFRANPP
jgi:poly(3-hydroxybutyrate) depolymerase